MCWGGGPPPAALQMLGWRSRQLCLADCLQHPTAGATLMQGAGRKDRPQTYGESGQETDKPFLYRSLLNFDDKVEI